MMTFVRSYCGLGIPIGVACDVLLLRSGGRSWCLLASNEDGAWRQLLAPAAGARRCALLVAPAAHHDDGASISRTGTTLDVLARPGDRRAEELHGGERDS